MESPEGWNLLTSSLAVCGTSQLSRVWAFLILEGLVRDADGDWERFAVIVKQVGDEGPITGPSEALRIAARMTNEGLTLPLADRSDPWGRAAQERFRIVESWRR